MSISQLKKDLRNLADKKQAVLLQRFFKTGKGEYGEGDVFLGIKVPVQRQVAAKYLNMPLAEVEKLLHSKIHEHRLTALIIWVNQFKKADKKGQETIYNLYLKNTKWINNWDLVDLSAHKIVGAYLLDKPRNILYKLAKSELLWEKRIAVVATFAFIANQEFEDTIKLARILLKDKHDLMHKAVGWALREVGKKSNKGYNLLLEFLDKHCLEMPRTMLRYAIERLPEEKRLYYLKMK
jgi:3-methyladenine DNA glycosylase AlkD